MAKYVLLMSIFLISFTELYASDWVSSDGRTSLSVQSCNQNDSLSNYYSSEGGQAGGALMFGAEVAYYSQMGEELSCSDARKWARSASALSLGFRLGSRIATCMGLVPVGITFEAASYGTAILALYIQSEDCQEAKTEKEQDLVIQGAVMDYLNFNEVQKLYTPIEVQKIHIL